MPASSVFRCNKPRWQPRATASAFHRDGVSDHGLGWQGVEESQMQRVFTHDDHTNPHLISFMVHRIWSREELELPGTSSLRDCFLWDIFTKLSKADSDRAGLNFSIFDHSVYKLQFFWHLSAKYMPHSFLSRSHRRNFWLKYSLPVASSPIPQALLALEVHPMLLWLLPFSEQCPSWQASLS